MDKKKLREQLGLDRDLKKALGLDRSLKERLQQAAAKPPQSTTIGTDRETGELATLDFKLLSTHLHVLGRTGTGKSRFLASQTQQLIEAGRGGCLLDIQGGLYHLLENYVAHHPHLAKNVIFFNPGEAQDPVVSFNPLQPADYYRPASQVDTCIEAIMKHMGQAGQTMPTFKNVSTQILTPLIKANQTILEAEYFTDWLDTKTRDRIIEQANDRAVTRFWAMFDDQAKREKKTDLLSFVNRLNEFVRHDMLRYTLRLSKKVRFNTK